MQRTVISVAGTPAETEEDDEDAAKPLPDRLITELTAHRTLALRDALAENPAITFQAVLHNFVLTTFYRFASSRKLPRRSDFAHRPFPPKLPA